MECIHCGYDKIQPNFNYCPKCKKPLKNRDHQNDEQPFQQSGVQSEGAPQEKGMLNRVFSGWNYEKAIQNPYEYAVWALKNPNDNRRFLEKWKSQGKDLTRISNAIAEVSRSTNPNVDTTHNPQPQQTYQSQPQQTYQSQPQQTYQSRPPQQTSASTDSANAFVDQVNAPYTTDAASVVRHKAIWKLQPGELARHIAPDEWVYVSEHLSGLVVEEGTSAIVYVDGVEVARMGSGMYVFESKDGQGSPEKEKRGVLSGIKNFLRRLFTGRKHNENAQERSARQNRAQQMDSKIKNESVIDVYLKSDRVFPVVFGNQYLSDSPHGYKPYTVQSRNLDLQVGVSMQMQIGDFKEFVTNYMAARKSISVEDITKKVDNAVFSILRARFRDIDVAERGLDEALLNSVKEHIKRNLGNLLRGVVVVDVLDITTSSEQLERFRKVEEQLYCSEREYDFLTRTNEFRNRLAAEENDQKIRELRDEQSLRNRLDEINRDNILHQDEMEQFVSLLNSQRTIREASNQADLESAMLEIQRNALVSNEEFEIFTEDMANRAFDREQVSEQLRVRSLMATALSKLEVERTLNIANIRKAQAVSEAEFDAYKQEKGHEAEMWDLDAMVYGRQYVFERQKLMDAQERKRAENAFELEEAKHENDLVSVEIAGKRILDEYGDERVVKDYEFGERVKDDQEAREWGNKERGYSLNKKAKEDDITFEYVKNQNEVEIQAKKAAMAEAAKDKDVERLAKKAEIASANMQAMQNAKMQQTIIQGEQNKAKYAHEENIAGIEADVRKADIEAAKQMSAEQLMAKNIGTMDTAAQKAFAESFSNLKEAELTRQNAQQQKEMYEKMIEMAKSNNIDVKEIYTENSSQQMQFMREMMQFIANMNMSASGGQQNMLNSMLGAMQNFANTRINDVKEIKEEYREQMKHEQVRTDKNKRQSLDNTTSAKVSENARVNINVNRHSCPNCGEPIQDRASNFCPFCGNDF